MQPLDVVAYFFILYTHKIIISYYRPSTNDIVANYGDPTLLTVITPNESKGTVLL